MNVYELDAASHNSVEDIRDLVDQVRYVPQVGKYKIYIIDEVHMLSNAAFNAFLKTLEEPPSYAIFILATTERHKVLPTILSRCQIFNFHRIKLEDIVTQLQIIATKESIAYEISALQLIAQKAEGALRDALSMFDLLTTFAGKGETIGYTSTRDYLQLLDYDYYFKCTEAFLQGNVSAVLLLFDAILRAGFNGHHFVVGLGEHFRNLLVCKDNATIPLLEVTDHIRPSYAEYASKCQMPFILRALTLLNQCDIHYKASQHQRLHVELLLIELATRSFPVEETVAHATETAISSTQTPSRTLDKHNAIKPQITDVVPPPKQETLVIPSLQSLKNVLLTKKKINAPKKIEAQPASKEPIIEKAVQAFFADYGEQLKQQGNIAGYHLMNQPIKVQDQVIIIALINSVQESMLQNLKEELLVQLRKKFNDPKIILQSILVQELQGTKPYTDQEKLTYLSKKNPAIALMRERFKLEVVY
jgi:DNA polymerase-3 subunit gamma/tau